MQAPEMRNKEDGRAEMDSDGSDTEVCNKQLNPKTLSHASRDLHTASSGFVATLGFLDLQVNQAQTIVVN